MKSCCHKKHTEFILLCLTNSNSEYLSARFIVCSLYDISFRIFHLKTPNEFQIWWVIMSTSCLLLGVSPGSLRDTWSCGHEEVKLKCWLEHFSSNKTLPKASFNFHTLNTRSMVNPVGQELYLPLYFTMFTHTHPVKKYVTPFWVPIH